ncbi:MAG TPA: hypothetical protein VIJ95_08125 [Hanamia sp.]
MRRIVTIDKIIYSLSIEAIVLFLSHHYFGIEDKFIELPFEKPHQFLHRRYKSNRIFLHLSQWQIANETVSLIHLHYAQIKRNPE